MTDSLNVLSRHFDAKIVDQISLGDIPTILSGRHPHLSSAQHQECMTVAAHESSHFLFALLSQTTNFGSYGYIRVLGKSLKYGGKKRRARMRSNRKPRKPHGRYDGELSGIHIFGYGGTQQ